eukprot:scaffold29622_cov37-Prasinocladus_malaysianus.AAC.1
MILSEGIEIWKIAVFNKDESDGARIAAWLMNTTAIVFHFNVTSCTQLMSQVEIHMSYSDYVA